jgi:signal transduction histidine kinase
MLRIPLIRRHLQVAVSYLAAFVCLDWISYVYPFAGGITPWDPQTGLSFALILLFGLEFLPWVFLAPLVAELLVRASPFQFTPEILIALMMGCGYGAATTVLRSPRLAFDPALGSLSSLFWLVVVALVALVFVAAGEALVLRYAGLLRPGEIAEAILRAFIGDLIGVAVFTPFLLIIFTRRRGPTFGWEAIALLFLVLAAVVVVFGVANAYQLQLFYLLFIPIVWAAVRFGLEGVSTALVVTQIGLIVSVLVSARTDFPVTSHQALLVVLAITGLALGVLVDEQRRSTFRLRLQAEALSRAARLSSMGEFAALVAHEINQPLMATANFARLAEQAIHDQPPDAATTTYAIRSVIEQTDRMAEVLRRLRNFIGQGRTEPEVIAPEKLVTDTWYFCRPMFERHGIEFDFRLDKPLPALRVDALQIEQVLVNLVLNSVEAIAGSRRAGTITVEVGRNGSSEVQFKVRDNGPGFLQDVTEESLTPFATTKPNGLGLGLLLARSIVEAHEGKLKIESSPLGAIVSFTIRIPRAEADE